METCGYQCRQLRRAVTSIERRRRSAIRRKVHVFLAQQTRWGLEGSLASATQAYLKTALIDILFQGELLGSDISLGKLHAEDCPLSTKLPA